MCRFEAAQFVKEKESWRITVEAFIIREASGSRDIYGIIVLIKCEELAYNSTYCRISWRNSDMKFFLNE